MEPVPFCCSADLRTPAGAALFCPDDPKLTRIGAMMYEVRSRVWLEQPSSAGQMGRGTSSRFLRMGEGAGATTGQGCTALQTHIAHSSGQTSLVFLSCCLR